MSNFNHANDKLKAPHCDCINNGSQFNKEMHYLKNLSRLLESAYEGFYRANNYSKANIKGHLQIEGQYQGSFYIQVFEETLLALGVLLDDMKANHDANMEGK